MFPERGQWDRTCLLAPQSVGSVYSGLMQGVGAAEKVFEFIDRQPTMVHDGNLAPDHVEGRVDFENVTFTYRTRPHTKVLQVRGGRRPAPGILSRTPSLRASPTPGLRASAARPAAREAEALCPCSLGPSQEGLSIRRRVV